MRTFALVCLATFSPVLATAADDFRPQVEQELPSLLAIYKDLHTHPELSRHEERTSAFLAAELRQAGYTVTEHIGKYPDGTAALGIAAILKNGTGPTVLVRTEMDALPVEERTGLPFASQNAGVMHACGHDLHMTSFLGTARLLAKLKGRWSGTLMLIGQPAEEIVSGARAMLADDLYSRLGKPDFAIALHDEPSIEAGKVGVLAGPLLASSTSVDVTIRGMGGHGARPELTKDPVVMAAQFILALQTIVSRQISPLEPAVVTVGSIHGGSKHNIIPDQVVLQLTTRCYSDEVRRTILAAIEREARGVALAAGVPDDRAPIVKVSDETTPVTYNDRKLAARLGGAFVAALGEGNVIEAKRLMVSEDFGLFGLEGRQIPTLMFFLGAADPSKLAESLRTGNPLPSLHSSLFYPQAEPALRTGILATTSAVIELMK
ncbi:MAG TPA: amidohydrolase [Bryobacteraceae bacterium]|nr:amidohydrolase [Bryobacteraceae bacterium]